MEELIAEWQPQSGIERALIATMAKAQFEQRPWRLLIRPDLASAITAAEELVARGEGNQNVVKTVVDPPRV